jgi:hypothetical protein
MSLDPTTQAHQEGDDGANEKYDEQNLRDAGSADRDTAKAEECGNERNYEKDHGIVKHVAPPKK